MYKLFAIALFFSKNDYDIKKLIISFQTLILEIYNGYDFDFERSVDRFRLFAVFFSPRNV